MLKRIAVSDLSVGMYLKSFCGSWMDHPFWRTQFVLEDQKDVDAVRSSAIREVWIDVSKGLDVSADAQSVTEAQDEQQVEATEAAEMVERAMGKSLQAVSAAEEFDRAAAICRSAKGAITSMFKDARMGRAIDKTVARQVVEDIADSVTRNAGALISLARLKTADDYSYMHSVAVCALMVSLARQMQMSDEESRAAGFAGLLHDIGKMDVPLPVLNKPGRLTDDEYAVIKLHPQTGHDRLVASGVTDAHALDVCLHHHEKIDGSGYPFGLKDDSITLMAKMGAVCDVYDAITSNRPYKAGWDPAESLKRMASWTGHFDSRVFQAFVRSLGIYPIGSLVKLSSGKLAVVIDQSKGSLLKPIVKTVYSTKSQERVVPEDIDLSLPNCKHTIVSREDPAQWRIPDLDELWSGIRLRA